LNYADYETFGGFQPQLDANPALDSSFTNTFFSSLLLKDLTYYYQTDRPDKRSNYAVISNIEVSGFEINLLNKLINPNKEWKVNSFTNFEKFVKLNLDLRYYRKLWGESQMAARIRSGIALPFGESNNITFLKQYSVGGPGSIRAWRPMELGPGAFNFDNENIPFNFQRSDFTLDFSLEHRFNLIWLLKGALFLDGGNIWTLNNDPNRPGSQLSSDFFKQIALGYGVGFRFDFTYFLIRFDFGFKLRYSQPQGPNNSYWAPFKGQKFGNPNIAVNYPF